MNKKDIKIQNRTITISEGVYQKLADCVADLNQFVNDFGVPADENREKIERGEIEKLPKFKRKKVPDLTIKHFTEAALLYFIKSRYDPRFYDDSKDVMAAINRLRNNVFAFLQVQELRQKKKLAEIYQTQRFNDRVHYAKIAIVQRMLIELFEEGDKAKMKEKSEVMNIVEEMAVQELLNKRTDAKLGFESNNPDYVPFRK